MEEQHFLVFTIKEMKKSINWCLVGAKTKRNNFVLC